MDQPVFTAEKQQEIVNQWLFQDVVDIEKEREAIRQERQQLEEERRQMEIERNDFERRVAYERQRQEREAKLFEMKWNLLETEIANLAEERMAFDSRAREYEASILEGVKSGNFKSSLLFRGVHNELALKKRYRDLMKIYHPDNMAGDTNAVQEISREYEELQTQFRARY